MVELPRRVDLRLTIPAQAPFRELATELAARFAEYAGVARARVDEVRAAVDTAIADASGEFVLEMASDGDELVVTAGSATRRASFPLTD